jgi:SAM-dependent methyltransferase
MLQSQRDSSKWLKRPSYSVPALAISACIALLLGLAPAASIARQAPATPTEKAQQQQRRATSPPYKGDLSIFEYEGRDSKLQVGRVMDILGIAPGKTVADIGAGSGWFSVRAARRVTGTGLVYAVDINPDAISYIQKRVQREDIGNVKPILSNPDDPRLPPKSIDAALLLKTYHEVAAPIALLKNLRESLRPGARVGIIDRNGKAEDHGVNRDTVVREARQAGYTLIGEYDFVKPDGNDYFLIFVSR